MAESVAARIRQLQIEVAEHKSEIARRRRLLQRAAAALDLALEQHQAECRRRGISLVVSPSPGTGDLHSHAGTDSTHH